jgi:hypothetical protein
MRDAVPLLAHPGLGLAVQHRELAQRVDRARRDVLVLLLQRVQADVGQVLDGLDRLQLALVDRLRRLAADRRARVQPVRRDAPDDLLRVEEVEHVGEVREQQQQARRHQQHREQHAPARHVVVPIEKLTHTTNTVAVTKKPSTSRLVRARKNSEVMCGVNRVAASCTMMLETVSARPSTAAMTSPSPPRVFSRLVDVLVAAAPRPARCRLVECRRRPLGQHVEPERQHEDHHRQPEDRQHRHRPGAQRQLVLLHRRGSPSVVAPATCIVRRISGVRRIAISELAATGRSSALMVVRPRLPRLVHAADGIRGRAARGPRPAATRTPARAMHRADPW